jgi:cytoskeletal protein RodZ
LLLLLVLLLVLLLLLVVVLLLILLLWLFHGVWNLVPGNKRYPFIQRATTVQ